MQPSVHPPHRNFHSHDLTTSAYKYYCLNETHFNYFIVIIIWVIVIVISFPTRVRLKVQFLRNGCFTPALLGCMTRFEYRIFLTSGGQHYAARRPACRKSRKRRKSWPTRWWCSVFASGGGIMSTIFWSLTVIVFCASVPRWSAHRHHKVRCASALQLLP